MKRLLAVLLLVVMLGGCASEEPMDRAMALRQKLLSSGGCSFEATVTADYGEKLHTFVLSCQADGTGELVFEVLAPDTIAGITGTMSASGGALTFDEEVLAFAPLADGQVAPVTAPWILVETLRGGYIRSCGWENECLRLTIDDSYAEDALQVDIWLDENDLPKQAEILWQGRRILTVKVENFTIL